ncbi:MAG TPA: YceI family protein [Bacteroidia bacterium]|jgi:polyisoprenoid-binding protein YceI|nr:YceI family protein [Bacteroidia bacterium]
MKTTHTLAIAAFSATLLFGTLKAQNQSWNLDKTHSSVGFSVEHMVVSETTGQFNDFTADVKADKEDFTDVTGTLTVQVSSVDTKDAKRDGHLKSPDFFDAEKYPTITFEIKQFSKVKDKEYKLVGNLTMHGVTRSVTLAAKFGGIVKDPYGMTRTGVKITGEIDRYDFGLKYNSTLEAGGMAIGKKVNITCNIELVKPKA